MTESARGDIVIVITADSDDVDRRLEELEQRLGRVNDQVERQTGAYQRQNRSLAAARRNQQRLLRDQTLHMRRLTSLNARYGEYNSRLRASSRELDDYNRRLNRTGDSLERIRDLSGDAPIVIRSESEVDVDSAVRAARAGETERERLHASAIRNREALERTADVRRNRERVRSDQATETEIDRIHERALQNRESLDRAAAVRQEKERLRIERASERQGIDEDRVGRSGLLASIRNRVDAARLAETEIDKVHDTALRNRDRNERATITRREQDRIKASLATARRLVDNFRAQETERDRLQEQTIKNRETLERAVEVRRDADRRKAEAATARARALIDQVAESVEFKARNLAQDIEFRAQQEIGRVKDITQRDADDLQARATAGANEIREAALESSARIRATATEDADQVRRLARDEANEIRRRSRSITSDIASRGRAIEVGPDTSAVNRLLERTIFRLQRILHSIGRLASELAVVLAVMAVVTLAIEALNTVVDLASVGVIALAGVVTFVYTNAMEKAARATSLTTREIQLGQQALFRLGYLYEDAAMIIEKATETIDNARIDPTDDANIFLQTLGIDLQEVDRRGQSALSTLEDILQAVRNLPESARFERLEAIFGDADVAGALVAAGASFRDDIERAADEIRVLNNTEIREINRLGGEVLAFFGILYSDVRSFFIDNIDAARTIVDIAQRELRPILTGLLDYFASRVQGFTQDPEQFISGVRRVANTIKEVLLTLYNALKFVSDSFQRLNLSPTAVTTILLVLVAVAAAAQVFRPLVTVLGYLHLAVRSLLGPLNNFLRSLAVRAGFAGAAAAGGGAAAAGGTVAAVAPIVVGVIAALGLGYLLYSSVQRAQQENEAGVVRRQRGETEAAYQRRIEREAEAAIAAQTALIQAGRDAVDAYEEATAATRSATQAIENARDVADDADRLGFSSDELRGLIQVATQAAATAEQAGEAARAAATDPRLETRGEAAQVSQQAVQRLNEAVGNLKRAVDSGTDLVIGIASRELVARNLELEEIRQEKLIAEASDRARESQDKYTISLLNAAEAYDVSTLQAEPLGDVVRRLGLTLDAVRDLGERVRGEDIEQARQWIIDAGFTVEEFGRLINESETASVRQARQRILELGVTASEFFDIFRGLSGQDTMDAREELKALGLTVREAQEFNLRISREAIFYPSEPGRELERLEGIAVEIGTSIENFRDIFRRAVGGGTLDAIQTIEAMGITVEEFNSIARLASRGDDFGLLQELETIGVTLDEARVIFDKATEFNALEALRSLQEAGLTLDEIFKLVSDPINLDTEAATRIIDGTNLTLTSVKTLVDNIRNSGIIEAAREVDTIQRDSGRSLQTIEEFLTEISRFAADLNEEALNRVEELRRSRAQGSDVFRSVDEALLVLRQIDRITTPVIEGVTTAEELLNRAELLRSLNERYGKSIPELEEDAREYIELLNEASLAAEQSRNNLALWASVGLTAINSLSNALSDIILKVQSVGDAFRQVFQTVIRAAIDAVVRTVLADLINRLEELQQGQSASGQAADLIQSLVNTGGAVSGTGLTSEALPSGKPVAPQAAGDTYNVNAYALGTASPADVEQAAYAGVRRGAADNQRDPYVRANTQRAAEGR